MCYCCCFVNCLARKERAVLRRVSFSESVQFGTYDIKVNLYVIRSQWCTLSKTDSGLISHCKTSRTSRIGTNGRAGPDNLLLRVVPGSLLQCNLLVSCNLGQYSEY